MFIEPVYTLAIPNPDFTPDAPQQTGKTPEPEYLLRPGALEFVTKVAQDWELIIFSSRKMDQLTWLVNRLDPMKRNIRFVLDRQQCSITEHKKLVKDLETVKNHDIETSLIIDYKPQNVAVSLDSALIIMHWNGADDDKELESGIDQHLHYLASGVHGLPTKVNKDRNKYDAYLDQIYKSVQKEKDVNPTAPVPLQPKRERAQSKDAQRAGTTESKQDKK